MRIGVGSEPAGLREVRARVEAIREQFRTRAGDFGEAMARATARLPKGDLSAAIASAARQQGLDPAVLTALVQAESGFRAGAISEDGALGLTQLMPTTAARLGVLNPLDPR